MTVTQFEKALLQYAKVLSKEILRKFFEFILSLKKSKKYPTLSDSQTFHLEAEFANYKVLYPSE